MNHYAVSCLIAGIGCFLIGCLIYFKNRSRLANRLWAGFELSIALWVICQFIESTTSNAHLALLMNRVLLCGVVFIPVFFLTFVIAYLEVKKQKASIAVSYILGVTFALLNFTPLMVRDIIYRPSFGYYTVPGVLYYFFFAFFSICVLYAFIVIALHFNTLSRVKKGQVGSIAIGSIIGFACGFGNFLPTFNLPAFPLVNYILILSQIPLIYAILEYRLMDIRIILTRAGIFIIVYMFVLGIPLLLGLKTDKWLWALLLMGVLSTIGPFIYSYLRQQIENMIFREQQRYQNALRELSKRMTQLRDLDTLINTIISEVYKVVQPEFIAMYAFSKGTKAYELNNHSVTNNHHFDKQFLPNSNIAERLSQQKRPMLIENAFNLELPLETLVVPFFTEGSIYALMLIGPKSKKAVYIDSDFIAFDILSSQASLAIENCVFWQEEKTRLAREEQIRRQRAMDHFSASLAHEIDNPIFAVTGLAEAVKATVVEDLATSIPPDKLAYLTDRLGRITKDLFRISSMIKAIREFSSQTKGEQVELNLDEVLEDFMHIVKPQFKYEGIVFDEIIEKGIRFKGNKIHLEEILVNFSTNAIHAVKHNNQKEKKISLTIVRNGPATFLIEFKDSGYGIKPELLEDIFLDFVTTKASSEGSGIGLGRVRKIVQDHGGKVWAVSQGDGTGAAFFVELPLVPK